jgi:hypothetical protein
VLVSGDVTRSLAIGFVRGAEVADEGVDDLEVAGCAKADADVVGGFRLFELGLIGPCYTGLRCREGIHHG